MNLDADNSSNSYKIDCTVVSKQVAYVGLSRLPFAQTVAAAGTQVLITVNAVYDCRRHDADAVECPSTSRCLETRVTLRF